MIDPQPTNPAPQFINPSVATPSSANSRRNMKDELMTHKKWIIGVFFLGVGAFLLKSLLQPASPNLVSTLGTGKSYFPVEKATITLLLSRQGSERNELIRSSQQQFDAISTELQVFPLDSFTKSTYQLAPASSVYNPNTNAYTQYEYRQAAQLTVSGAEAIQQVLETLAETNVIVAQTTYLPSNEKESRQVLIEAAIKEAREKAAVLAQKSGRRLGGVKSITEVNSTHQTASTTNSAGQAADASQIELQVTVNVTFEMY